MALLTGWVRGVAGFSTRQFVFPVGRAAEIGPGLQLTFLHGMGSKSG
jgi:hypothetical protein